MTKPKTDEAKAFDRAVKAFLNFMLDSSGDADPDQYELLTRDLTIVAHWDAEDDECECECCLGDYPGVHHTVTVRK